MSISRYFCDFFGYCKAVSETSFRRSWRHSVTRRSAQDRQIGADILARFHLILSGPFHLILPTNHGVILTQNQKVLMEIVERQSAASQSRIVIFR